MARHLIVAALAIGALLAACGQRGPLYLPAGSAQPSPAPRTPVLPTPLLPVPPLTSDPAPLPAPEIPTPDDPMTAPASSRTPNNTPSTSSTPAGQ